MRAHSIAFLSLATCAALAVAVVPLACSSEGGTVMATGQAVETPSVAAGGEEIRARHALTQAGFVVQSGRFEAADVSSCCAPGRTCAGNNPSTPYLEYNLPPAPGDVTGEPDADASVSKPELRPFWRLRDDEALVFLGNTPPRSVYFSWDFYLFSRQVDLTRELRWDSVRDSLNSGLVWTQGTPRGAAGDPSNSRTIVVMSANETTATRVRATLVAAGYSDDVINTFDIPSSQVTFGLEKEADMFNVLFRVGLFENAADGKAWTDNPGATLWRVTPSTAISAAPFPLRPPRARPTGTSEEDLRSAVDRLERAILDRHTARGTRPLAVQVLNDPNNPPCIESDKNCFADSRDTNYLMSDSVLFPNRDDTFVVVYGVNHQASGKTWYASFSVYNPLKMLGVVSVDSRRFPGSADVYLPGDPDAPSLYAWKIARACHGEAYCTEVPAEGCPSLPLAEPGTIAFRTYVDPKTLAAPSLAELIADRAVRVAPMGNLGGRL